MQKGRIVFYLGIAFFLAGVVMFYGAYVLRAESTPETRAVQRLGVALESADGIEISVLSEEAPQAGQVGYEGAFSRRYSIAKVIELTPVQTKQALELMKPEDFGTGSAACHDPGYVVRLFAEGRPLLEFTLCLRCSNIEIKLPFSSPVWIGMHDEAMVKGVEAFLHQMGGQSQ